MKRDLVIVGAGPAGVSTALFLAAFAPELTERIEIIDRAEFPREKICAGAIGARAEKLLESIGVRVNVPSALVDGVSLRFTNGSTTRKVGAIGRVVRRREFDHGLLAVALARGIRVSQGVRVTKLGVAASGVTLETSSGDRQASVVIGADGVGSSVRQAIGVPKGSMTAQAVEVDTETAPTDPPRDVLHFDLREQGVGYGWVFPTVVDGRALACRGQYQLDWETEGSVDVALRLEQQLSVAGIDRAGLRFKRYAVRGLELHRPMAAARVLLVGEAAGVDPLLGEGIAQAICSGAIAARYLIERLAKNSLGFADWRGHFARSPTGLDILARVSLVSVFRNPTSRRLLEQMALATPESLDVVTAVSAGKAVPGLSALVAGLKASAELAKLPMQEARTLTSAVRTRLRSWLA